MVNYKQQFLDSCNVGGYIHMLKENDKIIYLDDPGVLTTRSLIDTRVGTIYQVPSGKKARIIYGEKLNLHGTTGNLGSTTASDANTGMVVLITGINLTGYLMQSDWFGENLYLTNENQYATYYTRVYIIEVDA